MKNSRVRVGGNFKELVPHFLSSNSITKIIVMECRAHKSCVARISHHANERLLCLKNPRIIVMECRAYKSCVARISNHANERLLCMKNSRVRVDDKFKELVHSFSKNFILALITQTKEYYSKVELKDQYHHHSIVFDEIEASSKISAASSIKGVAG
ncbi:hypothetical protein GJ496_003530 [Pomphorhynchus laevis]|nr:hypothetical protein GJ496_003530 [Pomphorhynchus laevis]